MAGAFRVFEEPHNDRDIRFEITTESQGVVPSAQLELRDQVQSALTVIKIVSPTAARFREYFQHLLALAQAGLVGNTANPDLAMRALEGLKQDITAREAGRVKNAYMKKLGLWALAGVATLTVILEVLHYWHVSAWPKNLTIFEIGTMAGVWLSFGTRKPVLRFEELHILEEDRLEPVIRLLFASLLAATLALIFYLRVVNIALGNLTTDRISVDPWAALLFGILSGASEKALSTNVTRQAALLLKG